MVSDQPFAKLQLPTVVNEVIGGNDVIFEGNGNV